MVALFLCACLAGAAACRPGSEPAAGPNIVLVSIDTLRADHLRCYGYPRETSPHIDALAADGVRFTRARSTSSWTLPAHVSMMTSLWPHVHGVDQARRRPAGDGVTLAGVLREAGYQTFGLASWVFTSSHYGFDRGFDRYLDEAPARQDLGLAPRADHVVDRAIAFLEGEERSRDRPFFLFVHLFDPHLHYDPPPPYDTLWDGDYAGDMDGRYESVRPFIRGLQEPGEERRIDARDLERVVALYDGEVRFADAQVGRLLASLDAQGLADDTVVLVTSDHGEELDDHGSLEGHQWTLYEEIVRVPLVVRAPGGARGVSSEVPASLVDVAPTLLELAGIARPEGFQGRSLAGVVLGRAEPSPEPRPVFSETRRFTAKWSVVSGDHKLIVTERGSSPPVRSFELYDLAADPEEQHDLFSPGNPAVAPLLRALRAWTQPGRPGEATEPVELGESDRERLRALGYGD